MRQAPLLGNEARPTESGFAALVNAFRLAQRCDRVWELAPDGVLARDDAGGDDEPVVNVRRERCHLDLVREGSERLVPRLATPCGGHRFLEDHLTVSTLGRQPDLLAWSELRVAAAAVLFVEEEDVAGDAEVVSTIPAPRRGRPSQTVIARYGSLSLQGSDGFRAVWHFSRVHVATALAAGMAAVGAVRP